ncbi:MAG: hypothetical protein IJ187_06925 [Neisseriaceae bacterium]|nr:hypothetical protein [Neisseriaceae bacterium]MBQ9724668.1 hypothetical protein [Neisseriaceae bacterium]
MANENFLTKAVIRNFNQIINDYGVDGVIAVYRAINNYYAASYASKRRVGNLLPTRSNECSGSLNKLF